MPWWGIAVVLFSSFILFSFVHYYSKNERPLKRALLSMASGVSVLIAVNLFSGLTGVSIPIRLLSVLTSVIGGIPGVTLLLFLNLIV